MAPSGVSLPTEWLRCSVQLLMGLLLGVVIGYLAYRARALTRNGFLAAALVGGLVFGLGGVAWGVLLLLFFFSSSGLSRAFTKRKARLSEKFAKGSRRDEGQVFANGGLAALLALVHVLSAKPEWTWVAFAGAMAAVNADTWATELGVLSPSLPRLITSGKRVERGTSGAVSGIGYAAALGGALLIALVTVLFHSSAPSLVLLPAVVLAGLAGSTLDSLFGATIQAIYYCPTCQKETERHPTHLCGTPTLRQRGFAWLNNDVVNFACSLMGALGAVVLWQWLG